MYNVEFSFNSSNAAAYADNSFFELTKEVDAYNNKNKTKLYLSGMIAVACVVGIVANSVLGFVALGVALITTLNRFPYDQEFSAERIKSILYTCESALATNQNITYLKGQFEGMNPNFANVSEEFYLNLNNNLMSAAKTENDTPETRLKFLEAVVKELNDQDKLVAVKQLTDNDKEESIWLASLCLIEDQFEDYLKAKDKSNCLQNAKAYITRVTPLDLENDKLPPKTVAA